LLGGELPAAAGLDLHAEHRRAESQLEELGDSGRGLANDSRDGGDTENRPLVVGALDGAVPKEEEEVEEHLVLREGERGCAGHEKEIGERPRETRGWRRLEFTFHSTSV